MEAQLIVVGGKANKAKIALKLPTVIGRSRKAGLTVAHPMVSRQHCEVFEADGLLMVRDLGSLNGTTVAGQRVKESPLPPDAEFTVGPLTFRAQYHYEGDLGKLPPPVLAEPSATASPGKSDELDFQTIDEPQAGVKKEETEREPTQPSKTRRSSSKLAKAAPAAKNAPAKETPAAKKSPAKDAASSSEPKAKPNVKPSKESDESPDDVLFDDFLKGLT